VVISRTMISIFNVRSVGSLNEVLIRDVYMFSASVTVGVLTVELGSDAVGAVLPWF
jgi:hypothetical protein